jgi:hypothetical protein
MSHPSWQTYAVLGIVLFAVYAAYTAWFRKEGFEEDQDAASLLASKASEAAAAAGLNLGSAEAAAALKAASALLGKTTGASSTTAATADTTTTTTTAAASGGGASADRYDNKVFVMKLYDTVLHRAATPDEVDRYSRIGSEADILRRFMSDNRCGGEVEVEDDLPECQVKQPRCPPPKPRCPPAPDQCGGRGGGGGGSGGSGRVCLDKDDLVRRLHLISTQSSQLYQYINML